MITVSASRKNSYVDAGAKCSDGGDGDLSGNVVVRTSMGSLVQPGNYWYVYECKNSQGTSATPATRIVKVVDNLCPVCTIKSAANSKIEASFPYTDAGATCTDALDGHIATSIFSFGQVKPVNEIVNVERTGVYTITYRALDSSGNWNDGSCTGSRKNVRTITVIDTLKPVLTLRHKGKVVQGGFSRGSLFGLNPSSVSAMGLSNAMGLKPSALNANSFFGLHAARRLEEARPAQNSKLTGSAAVVAAVVGVALVVYSVIRSKRAHLQQVAFAV